MYIKFANVNDRRLIITLNVDPPLIGGDLAL